MSFGRRPSVLNTLDRPRGPSGDAASALIQGRAALETFAKAQNISIAEARAKLERASKLGRRRSLSARCP